MADRVLGFDPGPKRSAWALVERGSRVGRARFVDAGMVGSDSPSVAVLLGRIGVEVMAAVEKPSSFLHDRRRAKAVLETAGVSRMLFELLRYLCAGGAIELDAPAWRRVLIGKGVRGTPGDTLVKHAVALYVEGLPKRTNVHVRDALGVACVGLFNLGRAPLGV